jgi:hypothetical protein
MKNAAAPVESKKQANRHIRLSVSKPQAPEIQENPMVKAQSKIRQTFLECEEAQKDFENAFRNQERDNYEAFLNSEKKYEAYQNAIEAAFKNREMAEQEALEGYRKSIQNAGVVYIEAMRKALGDCKESTEQAGKLLVGISTKEVKSISKSPFWFRIQVKRPNFEGLKQGAIKAGHWFMAKKDLLVQKIRGNPQPARTESISE